MYQKSKHRIALPVFLLAFALSFSSAFIDPFHTPKVVAGAVFLLYLLYAEGPEKIFSSPLFFPAAGFLFAAGAVLLAKGKFAFAGGNYTAMVIIFFILLIVSAIPSEKLKSYAATGLTLSLLAVSVYAILQYYGIAGAFARGSSPSYLIPFATFGNRVYLADYLLLTLPFGASLFIKNKLKGAVVLTPALWALYICRASRSIPAILAMTAVFMIFSYKSKNKRIYAIAGAVFILVFSAFVYPLRDRIIKSSLRPRIEVWRVAREMFFSNPVFGVGAGTFYYEHPLYQEQFFREEENLRYAPHSHIRRAHNAQSDFIQLAVETGITGFLLIVWMFYLWFKKADSGSDFGIPAKAAIAAILASGLIAFPFHTPAIPLTAAVIMGIAIQPKKRISNRTPLIKRWAKVLIICLGAFMVLVKAGEQIIWEKGRRAFDKGDYRRAVELLEAAEDFSFLPGEIIYSQARAWDLRGFYYIAEAEYGRALETVNFSAIYYYRAIALLRMNQAGEAERYLEKAVYTTPRLEAPYIILIDLYNQTGRTERARYYEDMLKRVKGDN